jgi:SulP family sulfate permease
MAAIRVRPSVPVALIAVAAATGAALVAHLDVATIGQLPGSLPLPSIPTLSWSDLRILAAPAVAVAALAALESLLSATVADAMSIDERHDSDRELFGQGVANLVSPLFGGIPATAAIARTAVNVRSGASSRLAALTHSFVLLLVVVLLGPIVATIPLAALAGVLLATAARMVEVSNLRALLHSTRSDAAVLVVTFVATVVLDLATAVILGIIVAGALALRHVARSANLQATTLAGVDAGAPADHAAQEHELLNHHIVAYRFEGPLFFGGAHTALLELTELSDVRVVILRLSHTTSLDVTGAAVLTDTIRDLERRGVAVLVSGLPQRFVPVLESRGCYQDLVDQGHLFDHTPDAIEAARAIVRDARPVP